MVSALLQIRACTGGATARHLGDAFLGLVFFFPNDSM
jgi:hypothetical protein